MILLSNNPLFTLLLLLLAGCSGFNAEQEASENALDTSITIREGETVNVAEGITLEFVELAADSRCPSDVECVWEGTLEASFVLHTPVKDHPFSFNGYVDAEGENPLTREIDRYRVSLVRMDPYPVSTREKEVRPRAEVIVTGQ